MIVGGLIPAGTAFKKYHGIKVKHNVEIFEEAPVTLEVDSAEARVRAALFGTDLPAQKAVPDGSQAVKTP